LKLRRSVAVAAPVKQIVDPHLHHLNIAVASVESVAGEEWSDNGAPLLVLASHMPGT
jgi:hypothetical protein